MTITTHNGVFHADDVFAIAALLMVYPHATVVRTRDINTIMAAADDVDDAVVDVGGVYDPIRGMYDHHQREGAGVREDGPRTGVPYASFGLVWQSYFTAVLAALDVDADITRVAERLDNTLVAGIDAGDVGYGGRSESTPLAAAVSAFNPTWDDAEQDFDGAFMAAVEFATGVLRRAVESAAATVRAESEFLAAAVAAENGIAVLERFLPWRGMQVPEHVSFVVFPSKPSGWRVQVVPTSPTTFEARKDLPEAWAGLRGAELDAVTGVTGGVFAHNGRFIAGHETREGALALARLALAS